MAQELSDAFGTLADSDFFMEMGAVAVGFVGGIVVKTLVDGIIDLPNEIYGGVVTVGAVVYDHELSRHAAAGGGLYILDQFASRFGAQDKFRNALTNTVQS